MSLLPRWFAAIHETYRTPVNAVHFQGVLGIGLAVVLGLLFQARASHWAARSRPTSGSATSLGLLFAGDVRRGQPRGHRVLSSASDAPSSTPIKHLVVPILGVVLLIPAFLGVLGGLTIPILDIELRSARASRTTSCPLLVLIWMVIGVVAYFVLRSRTPDALTRVGDVMTEG